MSHVSLSQEVYNVLTGSTDLMSRVTGVFDVAPDGQASPYLVMDTLQSLEGRLLDASERAWALDVHIWSSYQGRKEVLEIADVIREILPGKWFYEELVVLRDPSGWFHGVLTIRGYDK